MEFPDDIWGNIMSWFHSAYREPPHYIAFTNMEIYQEYKTKDNPVLDYDGEIRMIENTLYRYILDDYSFCWFREASRKSLNSADCCVESIEVTEILEGEVPTRNLAFPVLTKTSLCRESI